MYKDVLSAGKLLFRMISFYNKIFQKKYYKNIMMQNDK